MCKNISLRNKTIKEYKLLSSRKQRKKQNKIILEGYHLLNEAIRAGVELDTVLYTKEFAGNSTNKQLLERTGKARLVEITEKTFGCLAQTENPQGIAAIARFPGKAAEIFSTQNNFFLILDAIQDPGNLGTIIRTAAAAGVGGLFLLPGTVELFNPKVLRASMGGIFHLPIVHFAGINQCCQMLREKKIRLVAADPRGDVPYYELDFLKRNAVVIGNENKGIKKPLLEMAEVRAYIPLNGKIAALNAAIAASVFIFENSRQWKVAGKE